MLLYLGASEEAALCSRIEKAISSRQRSGDAETAKRFKLSYWEMIEVQVSLALLHGKLEQVHAAQGHSKTVFLGQPWDITVDDVGSVYLEIGRFTNSDGLTIAFLTEKDLAILGLAIKYAALRK